MKETKAEKLKKIERKETKEFKEKIEIKEHKVEKPEHKEYKEFKEGKAEYEVPKLFETQVPGGPGYLGWSYEEAGSQANIGQRLAAIESALGEMSAFISQNIRPDLSHGAYSNEE